jgi:RNA polymerase sigma-70 factor, ECF subfamily
LPDSMAQLDDTALVQLALAGQSEYFDEIMHRHMKVVRARVVSIVRNTADVDDVVQEVFFKAWRALPTFRGDASVRSWLASIATNEALTLWRREQRRRPYETPEECHTLAWRGEPADKAVMRREAARTIRGAIVKLPLKYRDVVMLRDIEEVSEAAAATQLEASVRAVRTRLHRGRLRLAAALRRSPGRRLLHAA